VPRDIDVSHAACTAKGFMVVDMTASSRQSTPRLRAVEHIPQTAQLYAGRTPRRVTVVSARSWRSAPSSPRRTPG
jgi:hypothetical protein